MLIRVSSYSKSIELLLWKHPIPSKKTIKIQSTHR